MKSEWADYTVQAESGNLLGKKLTRNSLGNTRSQSSQLPEPLWADPSVKSGISVRKLVPTFKKKSEGGKSANFLPKSSQRGKRHHQHRYKGSCSHSDSFQTSATGEPQTLLSWNIHLRPLNLEHCLKQLVLLYKGIPNSGHTTNSPPV